jgi:hypothetical protein
MVWIKPVSSILTFQQEFGKGKLLDKSKTNREQTKKKFIENIEIDSVN